jgi:ADP-ribose pyrophosphatase YjhB (NUDIX family)
VRILNRSPNDRSVECNPEKLKNPASRTDFERPFAEFLDDAKECYVSPEATRTATTAGIILRGLPMWVITNFGFYSIVEKPDDQQDCTLTIRARVKTDLEDLRERYLPTLGLISEDTGTDYKYRARAPRLDISSALSQIALDIDYSNFKNSVAETQGADRAKLYHRLWDVLYGLQSTKVANAKKMAYGGVLLNDEKNVLLRRPKGDFDGYVWTFAKGKEEPGSTPEGTALREVKEETGYTAEIVGKLPGRFEGGTSITEFFLMRPLGEPEAFDKSETEAVIWITFEEVSPSASK